MRLSAVLSIAMVLAGCIEEPVPVLQTGPPTYYEDVTPILAEQCWCCHQGGGRASALDGREQVEADVDAILRTMEDGTMPPGVAAAGCRTLSPAVAAPSDIDLLRAWRDAGMPAGDPAAAAAVPVQCGVLEGPLMRLASPGHPFTGDTTAEAWCFALDPGLVDDAFLTGVRFEPGSPVVRNMLLQPAGPLTPSDADGWACPLSASSLAPEVIATWTPGTGDLVFPEGTGVRLAGGAPIVLRVQYDARREPESVPATIVSAVELAVSDEVRTEGFQTIVFDTALSLEQGSGDASTQSTSLLVSGARIHGAALLMFDHGTRARLEVDGRCLLDFPRWEASEPVFHWLAEPLPAGGATVRAACHYDTTGATEAVLFGDPPDGEICLSLLYVTR